MKWAIVAVLLFTPLCYGQVKTKTPDGGYGFGDTIPPSQRWEVWETPNFQVGSYDISQGEYVYQHIEAAKSQFYARWGLPDIKFSVPCRFLFAPNKDIFRSSFHMDSSNARVYMGTDNKPNLIVVWVLLDKPFDEAIAKTLAIACLTEYSFAGHPVAFWVQRGLPSLNESLDVLTANLVRLKNMVEKDQKMFFSNSLFTVKEDQWQQMASENKKLFDDEAACLCLLFRKEYGRNIFGESIFIEMTENNLKVLLSFESLNPFSKFDVAFKRYMYYVGADIEAGKMPVSYLR